MIHTNEHKPIVFKPVVKMFNKGEYVRLAYTVWETFYKNMVERGIRSYSTYNGKYMPHDGDDMSASWSQNYSDKVPEDTYQALMIFNSSKVIEIKNDGTNTIWFEGYDELGQRYEWKMCHCIDILVKKEQIVMLGEAIATVSEKGIESNGDTSHVHYEVRVDGQVKSIGEWVAGFLPMPDIRYSGEEFEKMELNQGLNKIKYNNKEYSVYKAPKEALITLISLPGNEVMKYDDVVDYFENVLKKGKVLSFTNGYFFENTGDSNYGEEYTRRQGVNVNDTTLGPKDKNFKPYNSAGDKAYMDYVIDNERKSHQGDFNSWDWQDEIYRMLGVGPRSIPVFNGERRELYSPRAVSFSGLKNNYDSSFVILYKDGSFGLGHCDQTNHYEVQDFTMLYDFYDVVINDGGGSAQMKDVKNTGRKCPNWVVIYIPNEVPTPEHTECEMNLEVAYKEVETLKIALDAQGAELAKANDTITYQNSTITELKSQRKTAESHIIVIEKEKEVLAAEKEELKTQLANLKSVDSYPAVELILLGIKKLLSN